MAKCVIIGSGLGGLSCGVIMAKKGYDVTVLEQGNQIGGCLQCFRRGGALFETGMHYVGSCEPGQVLHTIFRNLGIDGSVCLSRLNPTGYDVISFQGEEYPIANGRENFVNTLAEHFPKSRDELYRYYDLCKQVAASFPIHAQNANADLALAAAYQTKSVNGVVDSVVSDPLLRRVLVGTLPLYAGEKDHTPFTTHALITDFYDQSAFRLVGGSDRITASLADQISGHGGRVLTRREVRRIECKRSTATAVVTATGEVFDADLVISTIHPARTVQMLDEHVLRPAYRRRIVGTRNTSGAFTVYLKFRKNSVRYMDHNLYHYCGDEVWGCQDYDEASWPKCLLYMHGCHEESPLYAETGEIITYMSFREVERWQGTRSGRRGKDYEDFKRFRAERVLTELERAVPGICANIESYYTSTPLTYLDYTGVPEGSMYGAAKDVEAPGTGSISCKTAVPNLLLAGQSTTLHGMLGVLAGSMIACPA